MQKLIEKYNSKLENLIYEIRGKQVMLDSDLASLYKTETKRINEAIKNNPLKFPERFCFKLNKKEYENLRSKFSTSSSEKYGGRRYLPYVFTEQGIYMLATILKGEIATNVTIQIMDTFVTMKQYISGSLIENSYYKEMVLKHDEEIKLLKEQFKVKNEHLFFEGQIYDAYSLMINIFNTSENIIIIIDNYVDKTLLDIISKTTKQIIVITNQYNNNDYNKYKNQYSNITLKINNSFHDRFIIIDNKILYHCGASFKDLGKKCFSITKIEDNAILSNLLNKL